MTSAGVDDHRIGHACLSVKGSKDQYDQPVYEQAGLVMRSFAGCFSSLTLAHVRQTAFLARRRKIEVIPNDGTGSLQSTPLCAIDLIDMGWVLMKGSPFLSNRI